MLTEIGEVTAKILALNSVDRILERNALSMSDGIEVLWPNAGHGARVRPNKLPADGFRLPLIVNTLASKRNMTTSQWVGSLGVALLLLAFGLNLFGWLSCASRRYQGLNSLGAGLACYASWRIGFLPFVVLEGPWSLVALTALLRPSQPAA